MEDVSLASSDQALSSDHIITQRSRQNPAPGLSSHLPAVSRFMSSSNHVIRRPHQATSRAMPSTPEPP